MDPQKLFESLLPFALRAGVAIVVLAVGWNLTGIITRVLRSRLQARKVDPTLIPFLSSLVGALLKVGLIISVAGMVGIQTTSFVAILGAAGLAVGLALQGSLSNFAGGVLILLFRPFNVGDFIEACGHSGTVREIQIFSTVLLSPDNRKIVLPNGNLANSSMVNVNAEPIRKLDFEFGIAYSDSVSKAREIFLKLIQEDSRLLSSPEPQIVLKTLAASSVNLAVRVWCKTADYWDCYFDFQEKVKDRFDKEGVSFPFPQREVHLRKENS